MCLAGGGRDSMFALAESEKQRGAEMRKVKASERKPACIIY